MRLIIIDDQIEVLRSIIEMIKSEIEGIEIIGIHSSEIASSTVDTIGNIKYFVDSKEGLLNFCKNTIDKEETDRYLLDISLFENNTSGNTIRFSEYTSVILAKQLMDEGFSRRQILFYTHPEGFSARDFAEETKLWGKPLYRPLFEAEEEDAKKQFIRKIKEYWNV